MTAKQPPLSPSLRLSLSVAVLAAALVFVSAASAPSFAAGSQAATYSTLLPVTERYLPNGLRVIVKEVHTAPIVAVHIWVNTGAVNETDANNGISHFFEHMFFKGTETRGVGEMDRVIKELGGYNNAFTSMEYTGYYAVVPSENFSLALDVLMDATSHSVFDPAEIERERKVVYEEINRKEDSPTGTLFTELNQLLYGGTPYSREVLGSRESLAGITRETFVQYLNDYYVANNMVVVVVGDVRTEEAFAQVEEKSVGLRTDPAVGSRRPQFEVPAPDGAVRQRVIPKDVNQNYLAIGFPSEGRVSLGSAVDGLDVATTILAGSRSARLQRLLVEERGIASSVSSWIWTYEKAGALVVFVTYDPSNHEEVRSAVFEELGRLRREPVSEEELRRAKTTLRADFEFSNETAQSIAQTLGVYGTLSALSRAVEYLHRIDAVTPAAVQEAMERHVNLDAYTELLVTPASEASDDATP